MTIKLLDNTEHNIKDLEQKCYSDEFYYGYLGKAAFSSSALKLLLDSPKTYHYITKYGQEQNSQALRDGWLFHTMMLEPEKIDDVVFVDVQSKNTKKFKEAKLEYPEVFTMKEKNDSERLVDAMSKNNTAMELMRDSVTEIPAIGNLQGYPFRAKADILKNAGGLVDLKTTIDVKNFDKSASKYRYYLQVYIYCKLFGVDYKDFKFLCIDKKNLDIAVWDVSKDFYERGEQEVAKAIKIYEHYKSDAFDINDFIIEGTL
tara:strand:+ start:3746 stop:4522 length:777 start_codon:yes stop_codon:yes gene_type:complete